MGDPDLNRGEQVLLRTQGIHVKSIPFEGILTNRRIILVDRAKNIIPTKEIPLATVQGIETGENAIRDQILTLSVMAGSGEMRQMILTFSRTQGGNRARERDEWARFIRESMSAPVDQVQKRAAPSAPPRIEVVNSPASPPGGVARKVPVKRVVETGVYEQPAAAPAPAPVPASRQPDLSSSGEGVFCTRCGNRVSTESAFCDRCGSPIVAPATAPQQPASRRQYAAAAPPVPEPVFEAPAAKIPPQSQRAAASQAPPRQPPAGYEEPAAERAPEFSRPQVPVPKPAKKGLLSRLFSRDRKKPTAKSPAPAPELKARRSLMPGRKTVIAGVVIVVLIAVVAIGAVFVYPMLSSGVLSGDSSSGGSSSSSSSTTLTNTGVASITVKETTAAIIPVTGIYVHIIYIGSWKGTYGMRSDLQTAIDSGDRYYEVVNATGTVTADFQKQDSSTKHDFTVEIYKDGKVLETGTTKDAFGKVSISADVGGSAAEAEPASTAQATNRTAVATTITTTAAAVKTTTKSS